jgi:hypothetical protein
MSVKSKYPYSSQTLATVLFLFLFFAMEYLTKTICNTEGTKSSITQTSRLPHFLDSRLTDGVKVASLTRRPPFTHRKIPGTHFCYKLSRTQGHSAAGRIRSIEKSNDVIGNRIPDLIRIKELRWIPGKLR